MNYWQRRASQTKVETEGLPYVHPDYPDWTFWLRRFADWAPHYQRALARIAIQPEIAAYLERTKAPDFQQTDAERELDGRMMREAFGEGCIARWTVTGNDGQPLALTPKHAASVLLHFPEIYAGARAFASDTANYRLSDDTKAAAAAGN